jgi:histidinol-phosphate aminotransferase
MEGYVPGKQLSSGTYIKLNTNENPYPPSPRVLEALRQAVGAELRLYSDPMALRLRETAAELYGCEVDEVIAGMAPMIFDHHFRTFLDAGDVLTPAPAIRCISRSSASRTRLLKRSPWGQATPFRRISMPRRKVVIIVNPNAPTGVLHPCGFCGHFGTYGSGRIDEAYADLPVSMSSTCSKSFPT